MKLSRFSRRWFSVLMLTWAMAWSLNAAAPVRPTLALMNADGTEVLDVDQPQVLGWGLNFATSNGSLIPPGGVNAPLHARDVVAVASGRYHALALQRNGRVVAWGYNSKGQFDVPPGLRNVVAIAAGGEHSMALRRDGTVVMWGEPTASWTSVPEGLIDIVAIATGAEHTLALRGDGTVITWGRNSYRQTTVPTGLTGVVMIAAGSNHSMALKADGTIIAWGSGGGTVAAKQSNVVSIAAGGNYSGAIMRDGKAVSWPTFNSQVVSAGNAVAGLFFDLTNGYALSADGKVSGVWSPTLAFPVNDLEHPISSVSSNYYLGVTLHRDGTLAHWNATSIVPPAARQGPVDLTQTVSISANFYTLLALRADGTVVSWGGSALAPHTVLQGIARLSPITLSDQDQLLALRTDGHVLELGNLHLGELTVPVGLSDVVDVASGSLHSVALKRDGTVVAWGNNAWGQRSVPAGLNRVAAVAAGAYFTLALKQDGAVVAWGLNNFGQCKVPAGLKNVVSLAAGRYHTLALKDDGTVVAWGENGAHQCDVPQGLSGVISVSAVDQRSVAVKSDGTIVQWGVRHLLDSSGIWPEVVPTTGVIAAVPGYGRLSALTEAPGDFGSRAVKSETRRHDLLLNSVSTTPLTGVHAVINGPDADEFEVVGNVNDVIPAWTQKALPIVFKPQRLGLAQATLTISSNDPDGPLVIPLKGIGVLKARATPKASTPAAFTYEPMRVDRQTGLVLQRVTFTNQTGSIVPGLKFSISRLAPGVTVYSSSVGKIVGSVEVLYTNAISINEVISFDLVYSDPKQRTASTIQPIIVAENLREAEPRPGPVTGVVVPVLSVRDSVQGPLLEWNAVRGLTYVVEYSDNGGASWSSAVHRLVGGNRILWVDRGQPETVVKPVSKAARAYRVKRLGS